MTITTTQMKQLSDVNPQGTCLGASSTDLVGFYGTTPIVQRSGASQAAISVTTIAPVSVTTIDAVVYTTPASYTSSIDYLANAITAINLIITRQAATYTATNLLITRNAASYVLANELRASLLALGLIAGA